MNRSELDRLSRDPSNWHLYFIYFCPRDPRIVVPKRIRGLGWTLNFARPLAVPFIVFMLAAVYGILDLVTALRTGGDVRFAVKLLLALGIIVICYRLSNPSDSDSTSHDKTRNA